MPAAPPGQPGGNARKLNPPPKFGNVDTGGSPMPKTIADWVAFFRWIFSLWRVASVSIDTPESLAFARQPGRQGSDQEALGAAQAFQRLAGPLSPDVAAVLGLGGLTRAQGPRELDQAAVADPSRARAAVDELNALTAFSIARTPYPVQVPTDNAKRLEGPHPTFGTASVDGVTDVLTWVSDDKFVPEMVGRIISIAGFAQFTVTAFTDDEHVKVFPILVGAGTYDYYFDEFPPTDYADGQFRWYTDWTTIYVTLPATGTVDVAGDVVTWISGQFFNPYWAGKQITINGVEYGILRNQTDPVSPITFKIDAVAGTLSGVDYSIDSGAWVYSAGQYDYPGLPLPTARLGLQDVGLIMFDETYKHSYRWDGGNFDYAPGDPGRGYIVMDAGGLDGGDWGLCDGSTYLSSTGNGSAVPIATPDLTGDVLIQGGGAGHRNASRATWEGDAVTDDEDEHTHPYTLACDHPNLGDQDPTDLAVCGGPFDTDAGTAHHHTLSDANARLQLFSEGAGGMPERYSIAFYMRL